MPVSTRTPRERGELQRKAAKVQREKMQALTTVNGTSARPLDSQRAQEKPSTSAPSATAPRKRYQAYKKKLSVRVWWPPTRDRKKSDFSGMYWPAVIIRRGDDGFLVQYDNGEQEWVDLETVSPNEAPVKFGGELRAFHVGEFVEVSNDSETDPAAWLGKVKSVNQDSYTIEYPFHDCSPEEIKPELLRRARVYDPHMDMWLHIHPYQVFKAGQVVSPLELELVEESKLFLMIEKFERELYDLYQESVQKRAAKTSRSPAKRKPRESDAADEKPNGRNKK